VSRSHDHDIVFGFHNSCLIQARTRALATVSETETVRYAPLNDSVLGVPNRLRKLVWSKEQHERD
jgi:hypothetical protein